MNGSEVRSLLSFVAAACPQQRIDSLTPKAWCALLSDIAFDDAYLAAVTVGRRARFINPADIVSEVRTLRNNRPRPSEAESCSRHLGQRAASCGPCRSERLAGETA